MTEEFQLLKYELNSIAVFRKVLDDEVIYELRKLISRLADNELDEAVWQYGEFVHELYKNTLNLSEYILKVVFEDENIYAKKKSCGEDIDMFLMDAVERELRTFQKISQLLPQDFSDCFDYSLDLPQWRICDIDFVAEYQWRCENISRYGYGKWTKNTMFIMREGEIVPVRYPDPQKLSQLYGYDRERQSVVENTLALIEGRPALNALLYGDAGTGKSSTVKAVVNEFADRGLRLIEITKEQLRDISLVIDEICENPLKFIIFIDDLSFTAGEDCFGALKATLEGSASARADNMVIYATSNRRHLVKETFSDREGDDIHRNDTMQEMLSLSARFGLRVNFSRPDKKNYTSIVQSLAESNGIEMDADELSLKAEQFAISSGNGRSPRTAKQFIHKLKQQH